MENGDAKLTSFANDKEGCVNAVGIDDANAVGAGESGGNGIVGIGSRAGGVGLERRS